MEQSSIEGARIPLLWPSKKSGGLLLAPLQKSRSKAFTPTRWEGLYKSAQETSPTQRTAVILRSDISHDSEKRVLCFFSLGRELTFFFQSCYLRLACRHGKSATDRSSEILNLNNFPSSRESFESSYAWAEFSLILTFKIDFGFSLVHLTMRGSQCLRRLAETDFISLIFTADAHMHLEMVRIRWHIRA